MNLTWTPMDDSFKVVNSLLGGVRSGIDGTASGHGKTSIDFVELLVNGPPLYGPLAYIPIFCRVMAAIMLAPLVFLMLLDLVAYLIARTLHLYPVSIRLPRSPPATKQPILLAEVDASSGMTKSAKLVVGAERAPGLRRRGRKEGDSPEHEVKSWLPEDSARWSDENESKREAIASGFLGVGGFSSTTSPSVSILPSRTPSLPGSPVTPLSTISLIPLSRGSESPPPNMEYVKSEPADEKNRVATTGLGLSSDRQVVGEARVELEDEEVTPVSRNVSALDLAEANRELEEAAAYVHGHGVGARVGKGNIDWEGITRAALGAETGINQDHTKAIKTSLVAPVVLVSPDSVPSETIAEDLAGGIGTSESDLAPSSLQPTRSTVGVDDDSSSCPDRQAKYEAEQRRFRASSVGVDGPLGLENVDAESSSSSSEDAGSVTEGDLTESTETQSGDQAESNTPDYTGSLIALGNPVSS